MFLPYIFRNRQTRLGNFDFESLIDEKEFVILLGNTLLGKREDVFDSERQLRVFDNNRTHSEVRRVKEVFIEDSNESGLHLGQTFIHGPEQYSRFRGVTVFIVSWVILD